MLLHVVGTQVEIQFTAVRVHVPGKYYNLQQQTAMAVIIVLKLAASFVCCCLLHPIYGSIDSSAATAGTSTAYIRQY